MGERHDLWQEEREPDGHRLRLRCPCGLVGKWRDSRIAVDEDVSDHFADVRGTYW